METRNPERSADRWKSPEFWLVVALILGLMLSMLMIFALGGADKKDFLGIVLGAFGAWIGAGAAYFFGRENLREATDSMLRMRGMSPQERLMNTTVGGLRPRPLTRTFKLDESVASAMSWFQEDPERFFIVALNQQDRMENAVHEEALYRYLYEGRAGEPEDSRPPTLQDVVTFINNQASELKDARPDAAKAVQSLVNAAVVLDERQTAFAANETMDRERKFVAVVVNAQQVPIGYITTADIRRLLLSSEAR